MEKKERMTTGTFNHIAVVGEGKMGTGIFNHLLGFDCSLVWLVSPEADIAKLERQAHRRLRRRHPQDGMVPETPVPDKSFFITSQAEMVAGCELVIEAIPEIREIKQELFRQLDEIMNTDAVFVTNTSSIPLKEIMPVCRREPLFAGLHFFYPVGLTDIAEINAGSGTSKITVRRLEEFLECININCLVLDEPAHFILNRLFLDIQNEAWLMVSKGFCSTEQMDTLVMENLFPGGIFEFFDSVGLDTMLVAVQNYTKDYPDKMNYQDLIQKLESLVNSGKLGMKSAEGFHVYPRSRDSAHRCPNHDEILRHLTRTWFSACRRMAAITRLPIGDVNHAIKAYFGIDKGPFDE